MISQTNSKQIVSENGLRVGHKLVQGSDPNAQQAITLDLTSNIDTGSIKNIATDKLLSQK